MLLLLRGQEGVGVKLLKSKGFPGGWRLGLGNGGVSVRLEGK